MSGTAAHPALTIAPSVAAPTTEEEPCAITTRHRARRRVIVLAPSRLLATPATVTASPRARRHGRTRPSRTITRAVALHPRARGQPVVPAEARRPVRLSRDRGRAPTRDVMIATYRTRVVDGVTCRVVFDRVWSNGRLTERTHDWYAQTRRGTVWYFGERTATLDRHGHVMSREGSFASGVDGAEAGVFMTAHPQPGPSYHQEYYPGHAEDVFTVLRTGRPRRRPAAGHRTTPCSPRRPPRSSRAWSTTSTTCATSGRCAR